MKSCCCLLRWGVSADRPITLKTTGPLTAQFNCFIRSPFHFEIPPLFLYEKGALVFSACLLQIKAIPGKELPVTKNLHSSSRRVKLDDLLHV